VYVKKNKNLFTRGTYPSASSLLNSKVLKLRNIEDISHIRVRFPIPGAPNPHDNPITKPEPPII
jgi:hypothetical protein